MAEIFKDIENYKGIYQVSNTGKVRSLNRYFIRNGFVVKLPGKILKIRASVRGYLEVKLSKNGITKTTTVHSLVAGAFIPNIENKRCINHIDGDKHNANVDNLEWCTHLENMQHAISTGLLIRHSKQYDKTRRKIINNDTGEIFNSLKDLCEKKKLNYSTLRCYLTGNRNNKTPYNYLVA